MNIVDSNIRITSEHEAFRQTEVKAQFKQTFSQILETQEKGEVSRERLVKMLESLVEAILAAMDGRKCRSSAAACRPLDASELKAKEVSPGREIGWRSELTTREFEWERSKVEAKGEIRTADGRCVAFNLCLDIERRYQSERQETESGKVVLRDPLVINFAGDSAKLSSKRIEFDLDGDGHDERIPELQGASGYLVFDRNQNGRVDNGGELFGVSSGNGFSDLAALDADRSGWLDEGDSVFGNLYIWDGKQSDSAFKTLGAAGVGALWTGSVDSPFALKDSANLLLGQIRATGLWLSEDNRVGTLQQVDLALDAS